MGENDTVYVSGLPKSVTEAALAERFGSIGLIKIDKRTRAPKIWIYKDKVTGENKGDAVITYDDPQAATAAVNWFNNTEFLGCTIHVSLAEKRQPEGGGGGGRGGFRGGRGGGAGGGNGSSGGWERGGGGGGGTGAGAGGAADTGAPPHHGYGGQSVAAAAAAAGAYSQSSGYGAAPAPAAGVGMAPPAAPVGTAAPLGTAAALGAAALPAAALSALPTLIAALAGAPALAGGVAPPAQYGAPQPQAYGGAAPYAGGGGGGAGAGASQYGAMGATWKRDGDWNCYECGNINFARRMHCNRCGAPRGSAPTEGPYDPEAPLAGGRGGGRGGGGRGRGRERGGQPEFAPGDWYCPACQNMNFARRTACNRCAAPRPPDAGGADAGRGGGGRYGPAYGRDRSADERRDRRDRPY